MRLRRVIDADAIQAALGGDANDVLPVAFTDVERPAIARTIGSKVASLDLGEELRMACIAVASGCRRDLVLAPTSGPVSAVAKRYATITDRAIICCELPTLASDLPSSVPRSLTWFCKLDDMDIAESLRALRAAFRERYGMPPRIGVITAEDLRQLAWVVAKQLVPRSEAQFTDVTIVSNIGNNFVPLPSAIYVPSDQSAAEALGMLEEARGTLIIQGHSRPHCGRLAFRDQALGVCGLRSGGSDGRCIDGVACSFGDGPRFVAQQARAQRIYFDGCSTAHLGARRVGLFGLPREAMLSHAVLRSDAREFIGNVHSGSFGCADAHWLLGLSGLGYLPTECVEIINAARSNSGREAIGSGAYFGDPTNAGWPALDVSIGELTADSKGLRVHWSTSRGVLAAKLPGRLWAELIEHDCLDVFAAHPSQPQISILPDPWADASILLCVARVACEEDAPLDVDLRKLPTPVERNVERELADAADNVSWLATLPSFRRLLAGASEQLEDELIRVRRILAEREDHALLPDLVGFAGAGAREAAYRFDEAIIENALIRSRTRWELREEYELRSRAEQRTAPSACKNCGCSTRDTEHTDLAKRLMKRRLSTCSNCGVVADLPLWPLDVALESASLHWVDSTLRGRADVFNGGDARRVVMGATIVGAGEPEPQSCEQVDGLIAACSSFKFDFALTYKGLVAGTMRFRVLIASMGGLGFVGGILLVMPTTGRSARAHSLVGQ